MHIHIPALVIVLAVAVAAPLLAELTRRIGVSVVVLEILLGIAIGPQVLDWAQVEGVLPYLAKLGMAFLFFLAGLEIDLHAIRGQPLNRAFAGWIGIFALACAVALGLRAAGLVEAWMIVAIALSTTALGILVPILKDSGSLESPFGRHVMAAGVMGELGPILAMSLALSTTHTADVQTGFTVLFIAAVLFAGWLLMQGGKVPGVLGLLTRTMTQSSQLPIRLIILLIAVLVVLAEILGLDLALGALAAGMIVALATRGADVHVLHHKLEAIGFGFMIPVFFIVSGMNLDVIAIFDGSAGLVLAALVFIFVLITRIPVMVAHHGILPARQGVALSLYSATTLSLVVALAEIGMANGLMKSSEAAPLVGGAMLTVIVFPMIAMRLTGGQRSSGLHDRDGL
jgi:Kef-type K+ transport system membrane component KefB